MSTPNVYPVVVTWDGNTQKAKASCEAEYLEIMDEMPEQFRHAGEMDIWTKRELETWMREGEYPDSLALELHECVTQCSKHELIHAELVADAWHRPGKHA